MTYEAFIVELKKVAAMKPFERQDGSFYLHGGIRTREGRLCPIAAVVESKGVTASNLSALIQGRDILGLRNDDISSIMNAADNTRLHRGENQKVRAELLAACGLEGE